MSIEGVTVFLLSFASSVAKVRDLYFKYPLIGLALELEPNSTPSHSSSLLLAGLRTTFWP